MVELRIELQPTKSLSYLAKILFVILSSNSELFFAKKTEFDHPNRIGRCNSITFFSVAVFVRIYEEHVRGRTIESLIESR